MEEIKEITAQNEVDHIAEASKATAADATPETNEKDSDKQGKPAKKKKVWPKVILWVCLMPVLLMLAAAIVLFVVLYGRIATAANVEQVGHNLYKVHYRQDYYLDKALDAGIKIEQDLLDFINREMYFGYGIDANIDKFACSGFISRTDGGKYLTGRSFGLGGTDKLAVYSTPKNAYASLSMVSLDMLGIGGGDGVEALSTYGRLAALAAPYIPMDGVNEKGVFAALMDLDSYEIHDDSERPELLVTLAVRLILDRAASVDEAVELLGQYDIHTGHGWTQHVFITDATGDAAVVEWSRNTAFGGNKVSTMRVTRSKMCTNFPLYAYEGRTDHVCKRFDAISRWKWRLTIIMTRSIVFLRMIFNEMQQPQLGSL